MTHIRWTRGAYEDLVAIGDYIARRDPGNASRFVAKLFEGTDYSVPAVSSRAKIASRQRGGNLNERGT